MRGLIVILIVIVLAAVAVDWPDSGAARRSVRPDSRLPSTAAIETGEDANERSTADDSTASMLDPRPHTPMQIGGADTRRADLQAIAVLTNEAGPQAESILAATALGHAEPAFREEAVHALGEQRGSLSLQTLQLALQDPSDRVRAAAVRAFVAIGGDSAALELSAPLSAADPALRLRAVDALGQIGGAHAARYLEQVVLDENDGVRAAAREWLDELCQESTRVTCVNANPSGWQ